MSNVVDFAKAKEKRKAAEDKKKYDEAIATILKRCPKWPGDPL